MTRSLRRPLRRILLPAVLALSIAACGTEDASDWRYPGKDPAETHVMRSEWSPGGGTEPLFSVELPAGAGTDVVLLAGDVRGAAGAELVVLAGGWRGVYNRRGRLIRSIDQSGTRSRGFLLDYDTDGKLDLVLGSGPAAVPDLVIENGQGNRLFRRTFSDPERGYIAITPYFDNGDNLILGTHPAWPYSARGIASLSLETGELAWEYFIPSISAAIRLYSIDTSAYLLSNGTAHNAEFLRIGLDSRAPIGFDGSLYVIAVAHDGSTPLIKELRDEDGGLNGTADLYPDSDRNRIIVVHRRNEEGEPRGSDAVLSVSIRSGEVLDVREFPSSRIEDVRVLPDGSDLGALALSLTSGETTRVLFVEADFGETLRTAIAGRRITLGPVIVRDDQSTILLASVDESLLGISKDGIYELGAPGFFDRMIAVSDGQDLVLYGAGKGLIGLRLQAE